MLKTGDVLELRPAKKVWHHRWALWLPCGMVYGLQLDSVGMVYMLAPITLVHDDIIQKNYAGKKYPTCLYCSTEQWAEINPP